MSPLRLIPWQCSEHQLLIKSWWESRRGIDFPVGILPDLGYVSYLGERPSAALFLYETNSSLAWITWPISDPEAEKEERSVSLNALFDKLEEVARERGFKRLFTTTGISAVAERLEELGYEKGDENVTQYVKELG